MLTIVVQLRPRSPSSLVLPTKDVGGMAGRGDAGRSPYCRFCPLPPRPGGVEGFQGARGLSTAALARARTLVGPNIALVASPKNVAPCN
jgi:hypothetical protein